MQRNAMRYVLQACAEQHWTEGQDAAKWYEVRLTADDRRFKTSAGGSGCWTLALSTSRSAAGASHLCALTAGATVQMECTAEPVT